MPIGTAVKVTGPAIRVVLCTSGGVFGALVLRELLADRRVEVVGVVRSTRVLTPGGGWIRDVLALWRRSGLRYLAYLACATSGAELAGRWIGLPPVARVARTRRIPLLATPDVNRPAAVDFLAALRSDVLVSAFFNQRIGAAVCAMPAAGAINVHPSLLPEFKGVDPVFFARLRGARALGVTVHRVTPEFDAGAVLAQTEVAIAPDASVLAATAELFARGAKALCDCLPAVLSGDPGRPQPPGGSYDSWPDPAQVLRLRRSGHRLVALADWRLPRALLD